MTSALQKNDFRLAALLRFREATRDERRELLAEAQQDDDELARQLTQLDMEQQLALDQCRKAAGPGAVDVGRLVETYRYIRGLQVRRRELRDRRQSLAVEIDRRRQLLLKADQDVQILEKLRERRRQGRRLDEERQEAKRLDEAALRSAPSW